MEPRRRGGLSIAAAASLMLAAMLVWWLLRERSDDSTAAAGDDLPSTSKPFASPGDGGPRPPKFDLAGRPKAAVRGTIRDVQGSPIANAQVCAVSDTDERRGVDDRKPHCVRSGPDGHYLIDGLLPIRTAVHASAATFKPGRWERRERGQRWTQLRLIAGQTTAEVDITLEPGGVLLRGVVKDISGGEIEGAQVSISGFYGSMNGTALAVSGEQGEFEQWVAPGELGVAARAQGYAAGWVAAVAPGEFVELFLTPESVLVGKAVLADGGEPVEGMEISAGGSYGRGETARTDADGRFRIDGLRPGTYKPAAESEELYGEAAEQVHLGLGETSGEVVIRVHPAVFIEAQVTIAGSERPCTKGSVRLESPGLNIERAELDDEGRVEFRGVLPGTYRVSVHCAGHISAEEYPDVIVGQTKIEDLEWEVREGLAIRGEVVDEAGEPVEHIEINARPIVDPEAARSQLTHRSQRSESDGSFELAGLLPGRYEVTMSSWTGRPTPQEPVSVEIDGADVNDVRVVLPAVGGIHGRVVDESGKPVSGAVIGASAVGRNGFGRTRSNDAGEFELEGLRPGPTRVTASDDDSSGAVMRRPEASDDDIPGEPVEVVANEVVEVTLTVESRNGRITGVVEDEGGSPVADAFIDIERMSERAGANATSARRAVRWSWGSKPVLTDTDGRFELTGLPEGKFIVRANRKGGGEAIMEEVALGSHVELVIASTGELAGTVTLADGSAPERFMISIADKTQAISLRDSFFRTDGAWRFTELPAGSYEIIATASEGTTTLEPALELGEGEVHDGIELVLSSRVTLRGRIVDLETREVVVGLELWISGNNFIRGSNSDRRNVTDADGRFELEKVPTGQIYLVAWNRGAGSDAKHDRLWQPLVVAAEPSVQDIGDIEVVAKRLEPNQKIGDLGYRLNDWDPSLAPEDFKAVVATVRADGPAAGSGLAAGDVIEKVQGHDVLGLHSSRYYTLTRVPEGATVKLEIAGGKTVEITAGPPV